MKSYKDVRRLALIVPCFILHSFIALAQQDVQFSQYVFNPLSLNPAYAGYRGETYATAMYRKQWSGLPGSPETSTASLEWLMPFTNDKVAFSVSFVSDKLGPENSWGVLAGYAYRIPMNPDNTKRLCFGISAGVSDYSIQSTQFNAIDQNDKLIPVGVMDKVVPDANFGIYYYTPRSYFSLGINDLIQGSLVNTYYAYQNYTFHSMQRNTEVYTGAGYLVPLSNEFKFRPSVLWKEDFQAPSNFDFNAFLLIHDILWVGGSYRTAVRLWGKDNLQQDLQTTDALALIVEFWPFAHLRIGYSYDITTTKLNSYQRGTNEFSIGVGFPRKDKRELSPRYF